MVPQDFKDHNDNKHANKRIIQHRLSSGEDDDHHDHKTTIKRVPVSKSVQQRLRTLHKNRQFSVRSQDVDFDDEQHKSNNILLGQGTFCEVRQVFANKKRFAMKRIAPDNCNLKTTTPKQEEENKRQEQSATVHFVKEAARDLANEAVLLSNLNHKNIIRVHGVATAETSIESEEFLVINNNENEKENFFILLDRLDCTLEQKLNEWKANEDDATRSNKTWTGINLRQGLKQRRKQQHDRLESLLERLAVALEIAKGMKYLHSHKLVHCDLKPQNIGFDEHGEVKLFDLGLAMQLHHRKDQIQGQVGTPLYMAPEVLSNRPYGLMSDVYSFALIVWQLCSLGEPYSDYDFSVEDTNPVQILAYGVVRLGSRPRMENWWPKELRSFMESCWSAKASSRPSFDEIVEKLQVIFENMQGMIQKM